MGQWYEAVSPLSRSQDETFKTCTRKFQAGGISLPSQQESKTNSFWRQDPHFVIIIREDDPHRLKSGVPKIIIECHQTPGATNSR